MSYDFKRGEVARLLFKWPQDAKREREDGTKERHAVVIAKDDRGFYAVPISTVEPEPGYEKYSLRLSPRLKRELGLKGNETSWVKTNFVNFVEPPNPSIVKWAKNKSHDLKFLIGTVPEGLIKEIEKTQQLAEANDHLRISQIKKHDTSGDRESLRKDKRARTVNADGDADRRYQLNDPARTDAQRRRILSLAREDFKASKKFKKAKDSHLGHDRD